MKTPSFEIVPPGTDASRIRFSGHLQRPSGRLVTCWYGGVEKNPSENTVPLAHVAFRRLHSDGALGSIYTIPTAISHLGILRVGSVWSEGKLLGQIGLEKLPPTSVFFDEGSWSCITAAEAGLSGRSYKLGLPDEQKGALLIKLTAVSGKTILVPCMEFFIRCYGRSSETNRLLATYGVQEMKRRLLSSAEHDPHTLRIKPKWGVRNSEVPFLAHVVYSEYTARKCANVHAALQAKFNPNDATPLFVEAEPWFEGRASIEGHGYWQDNETFLMLRIDGLSDPAGPPIIAERERFHAVPGTAGEKHFRKQSPQQPTQAEVDLTDSDAPSGDASRVIYDPPFRTIGPKRKIYPKKIPTPGKRSVATPDAPPNQLAPGDSAGRGNGTGKSEMFAQEWMAEGILAQMWQTCTGIAAKYPDRISEVGWFTLTSGFQTAGIPEYQYLSIADTTRDPGAPPSAAGPAKPSKRSAKAVLIIRMTVQDRHLYIIEIYRKPRSASAEKGGKTKEDRYRGLMVQLPTKQTEAKLQLRLIFQTILRHNGRISEAGMNRNLTHLPHETFVHRPRNLGNPLPFERLLLLKLDGLTR